MAAIKQPTKSEVRKRRLSAGLSVADSANIIQKAPRTWVSIESGTFKMQANDWQTFNEEIRRREEAGELIVNNDDWITVSEAVKMLGRSRMYVARLVDQGKVRRVMKHSNLALYCKADLRKVRADLLDEQKATIKAEQRHYSLHDARELLGGGYRLQRLRKQGHLLPVEGVDGLYFCRKSVDGLVRLMKKEESMLSVSEAAFALGLTRPGLERVVERLSGRGVSGVEPKELFFSGRLAFSPAAVRIIAKHSGRTFKSLK